MLSPKNAATATPDQVAVFCDVYPGDPQCAIAPASTVFPGVLLGAAVTLLLVAATEAYQRFRVTLSWHDRQAIREVARLRNGIMERSPWHDDRAMINQLPLLAQALPLDRRGSKSARPDPGPPAKPDQGVPTVPAPSIADQNQSEPSRELVDWLDQAVVSRMAKAGHSLNYVCKEMGIPKGSSPRYQALRAVYFQAKDS